jgi:hypothetical protein
MARRKMLYKICRGDYTWPQEAVEKKNSLDFESAQDLVTKILEPSTSKRLDLDGIKRHKWLET